MSAELWILTATAVLAVVAIGAAVIAVRAVRQVARTQAAPAQPDPIDEIATPQLPRTASTVIALRDEPELLDDRLEPRIVEGRLIVPPTQQQVVRTALGRPGVRLSVVAHGMAHALRAESRDRISALMRREYRRRRRERLQAGRRAVRSARPSAPSDQWLGS